MVRTVLVVRPRLGVATLFETLRLLMIVGVVVHLLSRRHWVRQFYAFLSNIEIILQTYKCH